MVSSRRPGTAIVLLAAALAIAGVAPSSAAARMPEFGLDSAMPPADPPSTAEFATMAAAGVRTYRLMFFWPLIQTSSLPLFDWRATDAAVGNAARAGIETMPFFLGSPEWLSGCWGDSTICQHEPPVGSSSQESAWNTFLGAVVSRYGPGGQFWLLHPELAPIPIRDWQIWNEPNLSGFVGGRHGALRQAPRLYAELLRISAPTIRGIDPNAQIVLGGLSPGPLGGPGTVTKFLNKLYAEPGAAAMFDVVALHPYATRISTLKDIMQRTARVIRRHHDGAPVWVTEIGWSSSAPKLGTHLEGAANLRKGPRGQAAMVRKSFSAFVANHRRWRLDRVIYFAWRDIVGGPPHAWSTTAGLRRADLSAKPAWTTFRALMSHYLG